MSSLQPGIVHLWLVQPCQLEAELSRLSSYLTPDEHARADTYKLPAPRLQFTLARGFLRQTLARYLNCDPGSLCFGTTGNEKPVLIGQSDLHFNLSHTRNTIAIAIACDRPVGMDVEQLQNRRSLEAIVRQQFHPRERADWEAADPEQKLSLFYRIWTCKEAYLKGLGLGFAQPLNGFAMTVEGSRYQPTPALDERTWSVASQVHSDYVLAVAAPGPWSLVHANT